MTDPSVSTGSSGSISPNQSPLRIAFFTDTFLPTHDGVAETTAALAAELVAHGHQVTVFTVRAPRQRGRERLANGVNVRRHVALAAPSYPEYRIAVFPYTSLFFSRHSFDIVHIHTPGFVGLAGLLAARRWRRPSIGTYHSDLTGMLAGAGRTAVGRAFFRAWARFNVDLCLHCDVSTAPTEAACAQLVSDRPGQKPPVLTENGVDVGRFHPMVTTPDWHNRLGVPPDWPLVTFLGRLTHDKGVLRFLDAMESFPADVPSFTVVGGVGPLSGVVAARFAPGTVLAHRGRYVGMVSDQEKAALLAQSRVFVLPSLSDTSSVALLEAMACGAACVVTTRGGPAQIAQRSQAGTLVEPTDLAALRRAIRELLLDRKRVEDFVQRGIAWVRGEGSIERTARSFESLYRHAFALRAASASASPTDRR
jgi:glycosyltransferase involved in cell wall biosynthesis